MKNPLYSTAFICIARVWSTSNLIYTQALKYSCIVQIVERKLRTDTFSDSNKNTAFKKWIVVLKHSFQVTSLSLMSQSDFKDSLVIIISGLFSRGWSKFEQLPQILLDRELCSLAIKSSLEGQHEKSTDLPILLNLWVATDSITWRISGYSSTTSLKSSACRMKMSHKVFAVMVAVRLALVNKQISGIKAANTSVDN